MEGGIRMCQGHPSTAGASALNHGPPEMHAGQAPSACDPDALLSPVMCSHQMEAGQQQAAAQTSGSAASQQQLRLLYHGCSQLLEPCHATGGHPRTSMSSAGVLRKYSTSSTWS